MLTFATKKLSTGANGQKEDVASFFCPRSFNRAVMAFWIKFEEKTFVLPARLSSAAAGSCAHCYIGKVCYFKLLLVRTEYNGPRTGRGPESIIWKVGMCYMWRPCGVTWDSSRTVVVIKLRRTSALTLLLNILYSI